MKDFLHTYVTSEGVLIIGGFAWAILGAFLPQIALIPVPAIGIPGVIQTPEFSIGAGHFIALGLVPLAIKILKPGAQPFKSSPPAKEGV